MGNASAAGRHPRPAPEGRNARNPARSVTSRGFTDPSEYQHQQADDDDQADQENDSDRSPDELQHGTNLFK
jgi:hypothetical protein